MGLKILNYNFKKKRKLKGTIIREKGAVVIVGYNDLELKIREELNTLLISNYGLLPPKTTGKDLVILFEKEGIDSVAIARDIGLLFREFKVNTDNLTERRRKAASREKKYVEKLYFSRIFQTTKDYADYLEKHTENIATGLENFETYNVVLDEVNRSVDHLRNLDKNKDYFKRRVGGITSFLPLNQPLYSTICFGVVPSLMAKDCVVRPPAIVQTTFKKLEKALNLKNYFPNFSVSYQEKTDFIKKRKLETDVVIFTGRSDNGRKIYKEFLPPLFILNGVGHNPVVVTESAGIKKAVESVLRVVLYNQGQDCAGPNAILVHSKKLKEFKRVLEAELEKVELLVGSFKDRKNIVGPNTDPEHVTVISKFFSKNRKYCIYGGVLNPITGMIRPAVFEKPLEEGPSLTELFAPVIMIQPYKNDNSLRLYFENEQYYPNAMYVTVFGRSLYVETLIKKGLHTRENILYNTDLHIVERGFLLYGGLGFAASCVYFMGKRIPGATLPQRDIYQYLVEPGMTAG